jgi:hypothetical protein
LPDFAAGRWRVQIQHLPICKADSKFSEMQFFINQSGAKIGFAEPGWNLGKIVENRQYASLFKAAIRRTRGHRCDAPNWNGPTASQYFGDAKDQLDNAVGTLLGRLAVQEIAGQCIGVNAEYGEALSKAYGHRLHVTVGSMWVGRWFAQENDPLYYIRHLRNPSHGDGAVEMHAWLTTDALEILDLTYRTTVGVARNDSSLIRRTSMHPADHLKDGPTPTWYLPVFVGEDYLAKARLALPAGYRARKWPSGMQERAQAFVDRVILFSRSPHC